MCVGVMHVSDNDILSIILGVKWSKYHDYSYSCN